MIFTIGIYFVRIISTVEITSQEKKTLSSVGRDHVYLNEAREVSVSLTFPCGKTTRRFPTETSLMLIIHSYNEHRVSLSSAANFNITKDHRASD